MAQLTLVKNKGKQIRETIDFMISDENNLEDIYKIICIMDYYQKDNTLLVELSALGIFKDDGSYWVEKFTRAFTIQETFSLNGEDINSYIDNNNQDITDKALAKLQLAFDQYRYLEDAERIIAKMEK